LALLRDSFVNNHLRNAKQSYTYRETSQFRVFIICSSISNKFRASTRFYFAIRDAIIIKLLLFLVRNARALIVIQSMVGINRSRCKSGKMNKW